MNIELLESLPIGGFYVAVAILMMVFGEIGYQCGIRTHARQNEDLTASLGPAVGGLLGMTAFVLAFSFSMASSQNDQRKQNVLQESNDIGTAYLRADLLDQQYKIEVKRLLREYVNIRLEAASGSDINTLIVESVEIHKLLWAQVTSAARESPDINSALVIQSINDIIDIHEKRLIDALRNRIPGVVWAALAAIIALTMITLGAHVGLTGKRRLVAIIPLILAFAVLMTLVVDLNRPQSGLITVGQQSMIDLQNDMARETK
jgi:hypothetical protein